MAAIPRIVVAAPASGHGKTAVAVGLLAALAGRGLAPSGFKIGSDYVDAGYLGLASGRPGRNLDPRLQGVDRVAALLLHGAAGSDLAVVEGAMGLYDGLSGMADAESTGQVAGLIKAPVVLVVDAGAMGQSVAALVHGFRSFDELLWLGGVILTRVVSDRHEQVLREALDDIGVPVLGVVRRSDLTALPSRSLGVAPVVDRTTEAVRAVRRLGSAVASSVDLDRILALARSAPDLSVPEWSAGDALTGSDTRDAGPARDAAGPVIAIAGGPTFGYSYPETAELLAAAGAEVVPFDPLRDEILPDGTRGLIFGGGFPELYADELSANESLRRAVSDLAIGGAPVVAESTGLLWLVKECDGRPMCGVLNASATTTGSLVLGYRESVARASSPLVPLGATLVGHKSHRTVVTPRCGDNAAWQWRGAPPEGFVWRQVHASYLNLHWAGHPQIARRFVAAACRP